MHDQTLLLYLGLFFLISQIFGKIAEMLKAPHIIGYLISGILFGPYVLNVFSSDLVESMELVTDVALSIIAFSIGSSLKIDNVLKQKNAIIGITLSQAVLSFFIVGGLAFFSLYLFYAYESLNNIIGISILLGVISIVAAPATIMSLIIEYKAQGNFTNLILGVTAISDALTIILYSFALSLVMVLIGGSEFQIMSGIIKPLLFTIFAILIGIISGFIVRSILRFYTRQSILLGLLVGSVLFIAGISGILDIPLLLPIMVFAFYIENFSNSHLVKKLHSSINSIEEPILGVFFLLAGAHLNLSHAISAGVFVLVIFFARILAKYLGVWIGAKISNADKNIKRYAGLALLPSAGVAIGLILDAQAKLSENIPDLADLLLGIVLGKTLLNELISPFAVQYALKKSGETQKNSTISNESKNPTS
jgi:Kef-type K+ transport system membrane component KefB